MLVDIVVQRWCSLEQFDPDYIEIFHRRFKPTEIPNDLFERYQKIITEFKDIQKEIIDIRKVNMGIC